jgi:adenylylsulfate reductase subunit A
MVVQLLVEDNRAYGAIAFNFRTGEWYAIRAKAVVLAAGDVNRISKNASGLAFDSWHFPYNTGDAQAMGYHAGAVLANMESVEATLTPKGFSCQGLNALVSLGAYFVNRHGERFMFRYDSKGENARRAVIADAAINEYLLGNGPVYLDCRHLPQEMLDRMEYTLQVDRYTLPAFYRQKGVNFREELVEISVSELSIRRSGVYFRGSGLAVDENGETSVEALYAAGDCATVSGGISGAAVLGHIAGEGVVQRARSANGALPDIDRRAVEAIRAQADSHLGCVDGMTWQQFEDETRQIVTDFVGVRRSEAGLKLALQALDALARREPSLMAADLHGLMRVHEAKNIRMNAGIMATASLARTETRTGSSHRRLDFPQTDEANWRRFVVVQHGESGPEVRTLSTEQPLAAAFARSAATV